MGLTGGGCPSRQCGEGASQETSCGVPTLGQRMGGWDVSWQLLLCPPSPELMNRDRASSGRGRAASSVRMRQAWPGPRREGQNTEWDQLHILRGSLVFWDKPENPGPESRLRLTLVTHRALTLVTD